MTGIDVTPKQLVALADEALRKLVSAESDRAMADSGVASRLGLRVTVPSDEQIELLRSNAFLLARQAVDAGGASPADFRGVDGLCGPGEPAPSRVFSTL